MAVGSLGDPRRFNVSGFGVEPVTPEYSLGAMPRYGQPGSYTDPMPPVSYTDPGTASQWPMALGQMLVGLAQAGASVYAASKQRDLDRRLFQIVYGTQGGNQRIDIPDPLAALR